MFVNGPCAVIHSLDSHSRSRFLTKLDKTSERQTFKSHVLQTCDFYTLLKIFRLNDFPSCSICLPVLKRGTRRPTGKRSSLTINPIDRSNGDRIKVRAIWAAAAAAAVESGRLWRRRKPRESPATYHFGPHQRALRRHCDGASASECGGLPAIKRWRC